MPGKKHTLHSSSQISFQKGASQASAYPVGVKVPFLHEPNVANLYGGAQLRSATNSSIIGTEAPSPVPDP